MSGRRILTLNRTQQSDSVLTVAASSTFPDQLRIDSLPQFRGRLVSDSPWVHVSPIHATGRREVPSDPQASTVRAPALRFGLRSDVVRSWALSLQSVLP